MYRQYNREKLQAARHNFELGLPVEPDSVRSLILESWHRYRQFHLDPKSESQYIFPREQIENRAETIPGFTKSCLRLFSISV